jgi:hypothetical protein
VNRVLFALAPRAKRIERIAAESRTYLERLMRSNTTRVVFDLEQRVEVSRRQLESELRFLLQQITNSAERALDRARAHQQAGQEAVERELAAISTLRDHLTEVVGHAAGG